MGFKTLKQIIRRTKGRDGTLMAVGASIEGWRVFEFMLLIMVLSLGIRHMINYERLTGLRATYEHPEILSEKYHDLSTEVKP